MKFVPNLARIAGAGALPLGMALALTACQGEAKKDDQKGTAEGEILPGSASDAMLPYDTVRSQPPLAPLPIATGKAGTQRRGDAAVVAEDETATDEGPGDPPPEAAPAPKATE